ncbi:glutamine cyclotransferase [Mucilaginibacter gracilis]|uniref:Glutamine cyclotransferase n=1 Tax=Mucilaginibacter gracilis TaxID=423350 RepID=A0A495IZ24_9SPHI|nr:glutaminyl-peptide cyclotransferase [Mucilaginibacter gracilis]RKR81338.1 glutamine cyclotransferase [Mucilaginibacter gracilis]
MKNRVIVLVAFLAVALAACKTHETASLSISPNDGTSYKLGNEIAVKVVIPPSIKADSIQYLIDSVRVTSRKDTLTAKLKTDSLKLGNKLITAKVFADGKPTEISTNVLLLAAKAPEVYTYQVEKVFPHDTASFTEGLQYVDGAMYESTGLEKQSYLLKTDLNTGKTLKSVKLDSAYFGEGIAVVGDKIMQLTYKTAIGFVYDKNTFKQIGTFNYNWGKEGWGVCFDGKTIYNDDGTNRIFMLNKDTYRPYSFIDVYDDTKAIDSINEMEYIDGKIYANIWQTDTIIVINPRNGAVLQRIDLSKLYPLATRNHNADVLNGIAWDAKGRRMFITGKKWDKMFQVKFVKQ